MSLFQQAAYLNNIGVLALLQGNYEVATANMGHSVKLMQSELALLKAASSDDQEEKLVGGQQQRRSIQRPAKKQRFQQQQQQDNNNSTRKVHIPAMESCDTIVFNQAIQIPTDIACPTDLDLSIYSAVVIFNLALSFHFQASSSSSMGCGCGDHSHNTTMTPLIFTKKAEKLYSMVLKLLDEKSMIVSHTALLVKLACYNNLSQLRYSMGDNKNAKEGFNQISCWFRNQLSWSSSSSSTNVLLLQDSEVQRLLVNALLLKEPMVATAA